MAEATQTDAQLRCDGCGNTAEAGTEGWTMRDTPAVGNAYCPKCQKINADDSDRLVDAFAELTADERQLLTCALAGNHPERLAPLRSGVLRALAKADGQEGDWPGRDRGYLEGRPDGI